MGDLAAWLRDAPPGPETAFEAHDRLVTIHPFSDGNGRTARLLMNLILIRAGYPPITVGPEERARYLDALDTRRVDGDAAPYDELMRERLVSSLREYLQRLGDAP